MTFFNGLIANIWKYTFYLTTFSRVLGYDCIVIFKNIGFSVGGNEQKSTLRNHWNRNVICLFTTCPFIAMLCELCLFFTVFLSSLIISCHFLLLSCVPASCTRPLNLLLLICCGLRNQIAKLARIVSKIRVSRRFLC